MEVRSLKCSYKRTPRARRSGLAVASGIWRYRPISANLDLYTPLFCYFAPTRATRIPSCSRHRPTLILPSSPPLTERAPEAFQTILSHLTISASSIARCSLPWAPSHSSP